MYNFICNLNFFISTALYFHFPKVGWSNNVKRREIKLSLMSIIRYGDLSRRQATSVLERVLVPLIIAQVNEESLLWIQFANDFGFGFLFKLVLLI